MRGRDQHPGQRRNPVRWEARSHQQPEGRGRAGNRDRLPGSRTLRQPRRGAEHVPGPRGTRLALALERAAHGAAHGRDPQVVVCHDHPLDPSAGCLAVGRPAAVGRSRQGRAVELQGRHSRRAHRGARRRADAPGARPRQAPRRAGPVSRAHLAQPARRLRSGDAHHSAAPRAATWVSTSGRRPRSRRSCRRSPQGFPPRSRASRRQRRSWRRELGSRRSRHRGSASPKETKWRRRQGSGAGSTTT